MIAKFLSTGLTPHDIDTGEAEKFLGTPEDKEVFGAVIIWMLDEGIIRSKHVWSGIGDLVGGFAGGFTKSIAGGG